MFGNKKFTLAILHKFSDQSLFFLYDTSAICFLSLTGEQKKFSTLLLQDTTCSSADRLEPENRLL